MIKGPEIIKGKYFTAEKYVISADNTPENEEETAAEEGEGPEGEPKEPSEFM